MTASQDSECIHGLTSSTCTMCKHGPDATVPTLDHAAVCSAVEALSPPGDFTTIDVATHPSVVSAHGASATHPRCNQMVGAYLTDAWQTLSIEQVSPKGRSNAKWRATS